MSSTFDSGKALGFFWDVFKARPVAFIGMGIWTVALIAALGAAQYAPLMAYLQDSQTIAPDDTEALFASLAQFYGALGPIWLIGMVGGVLIEVAWLRLFVRGECTPAMPFRISKDEGGYLLTKLALAGIRLGAYIAWIIALIVIGLVIGLALSQFSAALATVGIFVAIFASALPFLWLLVRLSPALALAVKRQAFALGDAWTGTKGWFWPMFGTYLIAYVVMLVLLLVIFAGAFLFGYDMTGISTTPAIMPITGVVIFYAIQGAIMIIPQAMMRGIAVKAALTIDEASPPQNEAATPTV